MPTKLPNGVLICNVSPHEFNFWVEKGGVGVEVIVPSDGVVNALTWSDDVLWKSKYKLVSFTYLPTPQGRMVLDNLQRLYPDALVVGSIIAAQAYPGEVLAGVPKDKRRREGKSALIRADRFVTFPKKEEFENGKR